MQVSTLLSGQLHVPHLGWNLEILALLETVRRTGVAQASRFQIGLDEGGEFLSLAVHHVIEENHLAVTELLLFLRRNLHPVDFVGDIDFACAFRRVRVVAGVGRAARRLVQLHVGGEYLAVLALHALHEDGLSGVQILDLLLCQFHAPECLAVEELVVLEDELDAPALGIYLNEGVELVARLGDHALDIDLLAFTQILLLLFGKLYTLDFLWDKGILRFHGDHLVGQLVDADEGRDKLPVASFQLHDTPHVARLEQVMLILLGKDMTEVRAVKVGFLPDTVNTEHHVARHGLLEGQTGVRSQYGRAEVHADGHDLIGLVATEHLFEQSAFLKVFAGNSEILELFPVNHGFVVTVLGLRLAVGCGSLLLGFIFLCHFFLIFGVDTLVFLVAWDNLVLLEKFFHGFCLFSCGNILDGLLHGRVVQLLLLDGEDSEACRIFQLAPEVLDEIFEGIGIAVNLQEGIAVLLVGGNRAVLPVLSDLRYRFQNQFHLVEDKHDVTHLLIFGDLRFRGFFPCIFLCHNI